MNGPSCLSLLKLFGVLIIFNAKFNLALGIVRISRGFRILGCLYYSHNRVCLQMIYSGDLYHIGSSKLICEANRWTGSCVMRFLRKDCSEQDMILCGSAKYTTFLCFSIQGGDARVPAQSHTSSVEGFLERSLTCWLITVLSYVSILIQVRLSYVKKIPQHCNNFTLEDITV